MTDRLWRARRGLTWLALALLFSTFIAPVAALADTNLVVGGEAVIAYANGDDVRLRERPSKDSSVVALVREGDAVDVFDGPLQDDDGNAWYQVGFDGESGYIISDYLALLTGPDASSPDQPFNPASDVIGVALIAGTNNDGVRCRADADPGAAVITVIPEGTLVDITGAAVGEWQPINCAGQSGYVHTDFINYDVSGDSGGGTDSGDSEVETASIAGSAIVAGTNGDGVRCRASASYSSDIITVLSEGSEVTLRDVVKGDFQGVVCAGQNGYAAAIYLSTDGSGGSVGDAGSDTVVGSAFVAGTNGDGVRCRAGAGLDASVIVVLSEGTEVSLRDASDGDWQGVVCGGSNGFIRGDFLSSDDSSDGGSDSGGDVSGSGVISGTNGDGVRCRKSGSFDGSVITVLSEGDGVDLRGDQDGDWLPVVCDGRNGWVFADFVDIGGSGGSSGGDSSGEPSNSDFSSGDVAVVAGTDGTGVRLRASASFDGAIMMVVNEGKSVDVIDGSSGDWVAVSVSGTSGFINMAYLASGAGQDDTGGSGGDALSSGDHAMTLSNLNLRYDPSYSGGVAAVAPEGTVVQITGRGQNGFYPVDWDGLQGYMHGDYLSFTDEALSSRGGSADGGSDTSGGGGPSTGSSGSAIVDFALQYLGYPYVWATHGPSSFDCSGFTYWVMINTLGIDIGASTDSQIGYGTPVNQSDLQPGDLVFFQNTYTWGLSHVGLYIGKGQFFQAENESTGVVISNLNSDYYASRWYGARRIG